MDWIQKKPSACSWALKLIKDSFHPGGKLGDKLVETEIGSRRCGRASICNTGKPQADAGEQARPAWVMLPLRCARPRR
jgi:hypothetical protein